MSENLTKSFIKSVIVEVCRPNNHGQNPLINKSKVKKMLNNIKTNGNKKICAHFGLNLNFGLNLICDKNFANSKLGREQC